MRTINRRPPTGASRLPSSRLSIKDMQGVPQQPWIQTIVDGINDVQIRYDTLTTQNSIHLQQFSNIEIIKATIVTGNPWKNVTLQGTWTTHKDTLRICKLYDGSVQLNGSVTGGVAGSTIGLMPLAIGPIGQTRIAVSANGAYGDVSIFGNGTIKHQVGSTTNVFIHARWMPKSNQPQPLDCFPMDISTRFKTRPEFVLAVMNDRQKETDSKFICSPIGPSWRHYISADGPVIQILDIPGLEYDTRQQVTFLLLGR